MTRRTLRAQSRVWCFTENNEAQTYYSSLEGMYTSLDDHIRYVCGQLETASTGQKHFQGYVQLKRSRALTWLKRNISATAHFEKQRGTNTEARDYCKKEDTADITGPFIEFGDFSKGRGHRTDIKIFRDLIQSGKTKSDLVEEVPVMMAKFPKFYDLVRGLKRPLRETDLKVRLNYGRTGKGKTRYAHDTFPDHFEVPLSNGTMWFDGYDLHKDVLIDDFAGKMSKFPLTNTLKMLDRYPIQVPIKGGYTWWMPNNIVVTTNIHPKDWYNYDGRQEQFKALMRRITEVFVYTDDDIIQLQGEQREDWESGDSIYYYH